METRFLLDFLSSFCWLEATALATALPPGQKPVSKLWMLTFFSAALRFKEANVMLPPGLAEASVAKMMVPFIAIVSKARSIACKLHSGQSPPPDAKMLSRELINASASFEISLSVTLSLNVISWIVGFRSALSLTNCCIAEITRKFLHSYFLCRLLPAIWCEYRRLLWNHCWVPCG